MEFCRLRKTMLFAVMAALVLLVANVSPSIGKEPLYGGIMIMSEDEGGKSNYVTNYVIEDYEPLYQIFSRLVQEGFTSADIVPDLAYNWTYSADYKTWTFYIYANATFHDGVACTAADVKWTFESVVADGGPFAPQFSVIDTITTPNNSTIVFNLKKGDAVFPNRLVGLNAPVILPKHLYENTDVRENPYNQKPVGTGPYKWSDESLPGVYTIMYRYDKYFRGDLPYLDKIIIRFIPESTTAVASLEVNEIQASYSSMNTRQSVQMSANPQLRVYHALLDSFLHLDFNVSSPPFDDARVRRAVAYAVNKTDLNMRIYNGWAKETKTPFLMLPEWVQSTDPAAQLPTLDRAEAERLLDLAGYPRGAGGVRFTTNYWTWTSTEQSDATEVIRQHLKAVGIECNVFNLDSPTYNNKILTNHDFDGMTQSGGYLGYDPSGLALLVGTGGIRNVGEYSNATVDNLFVQGASVAGKTERKAYYEQIAKMVVQDMPTIPLVQRIRNFANRADYSGFFFEPEAGKTLPYKALYTVQWAGGEPREEPEPITPVDNTTIIALTQAVQALNGMTNTLGDAVETLQATVQNLNSQLVMSTNIAYIAVAISIIAAVAVVVVVVRRKK